jgi:hypothetical protein
MRPSRCRLLVAAAVVALAAACGPSPAQIRRAREARYDAPRAEMLRLAQAAVEPSYPVEKVDPDAGIILTAPRLHEPDGAYAATDDRDRKAGMNARSESGSVLLGFRVVVLGDAAPFQVLVEPVAKQKRANYSALYEFLPDDPAMPGWIAGKVDNLQLDVHRRLARWVAPAPAVAQN